MCSFLEACLLHSYKAWNSFCFKDVIHLQISFFYGFYLSDDKTRLRPIFWCVKGTQEQCWVWVLAPCCLSRVPSVPVRVSSLCSSLPTMKNISASFGICSSFQWHKFLGSTHWNDLFKESFNILAGLWQHIADSRTFCKSVSELKMSWKCTSLKCRVSVYLCFFLLLSP